MMRSCENCQDSHCSKYNEGFQHLLHFPLYPIYTTLAWVSSHSVDLPSSSTKTGDG